jgi:xanthine/uracil permease
MTTRRNKMLATVVIIIVSVGVFVVFMYYQVNNEKTVHAYTGILFGILPAILINSIWNRGKKKSL